MADPKQKFVAAVMTREQIADDLNSYLSGMEYKGSVLTADDDRLTDAICTEYVTMISNAEGGGYTEEDLQENIAEVQFDTLTSDLGFDLSSAKDELPRPHHESDNEENEVDAPRDPNPAGAEAMIDYKSQAARDAQQMGYGDPGYWASLDEKAQEHIGKGVSNALTRSLSETLKGNDGI